MKSKLTGRSFLKELDFTSEELIFLLDLARDLKQKKRDGVSHKWLTGKNIVLLFQKTSTRTRCSFEVGAMDLGMGVTYLDPASSQMGNKESMSDTARVLGRFYDGIEFRGFSHSDVETLAEYAGVPVWNGLSTEWHPTQTLADILTMQEAFGRDVAGKKLVFLGDAANNVARSLMVMCAKLGINFVACGPSANMPDVEVVSIAREIAASNGSTIELSEDAKEAVCGAHVVYTDVWVSMGEPDEVWETRLHDLQPYRVTKDLMRGASPDAIFLHCLPSFHNTDTTIGAKIAKEFGVSEMEVTDEVFEGNQSRVFQQAENRMHTIKAVMLATLADEF